MAKNIFKGKVYGETNAPVDNTVTEDSENAVTSAGIYAYVAELEKKLEEMIRRSNTSEIDTVYFDSNELLSLVSKASGEAFCKVEIHRGSEVYNCYCTCKVQGNTSAGFPKKNYTVKFYQDENLSKKFKIDVGWGPQSKYCFKANYIDATQVRNVLSAKIMGEAVATRPDSDWKTLISKAPNNGLVDGFPIKVMVNGQFHGLYTWNIPKDAWMYNLNEKNDKQALFCSDFHTDVTAFKALWNTTTDPEMDDWELEVGTWSDDLLAAYNRLANFIINSTDEEFKNNINDYIDLYSIIDYYCYCAYAYHPDGITKNMILATYDSVHWGIGLYDMDAVFCLHYLGTYFYDIDSHGVEWYPEGNLLFQRVRTCFPDEVYARYKELRNTFLSLSHVSEVAEKINNKFTEKLKNLEWSKWTGIPQTSTNTVDKLEEIAYTRAKYVDQRMARVEWGDVSNPDTPYSSENPIVPGSSFKLLNNTSGKNRISGSPMLLEDEWALFYDLKSYDWKALYDLGSYNIFTRLIDDSPSNLMKYGSLWLFTYNMLESVGDNRNGTDLRMNNYFLKYYPDGTDPISDKFVICKRRISEENEEDEYVLQIFLEDGKALTIPYIQDSSQTGDFQFPVQTTGSNIHNIYEFFYKAGFCPSVENISKLLYRDTVNKKLKEIVLNTSDSTSIKNDNTELSTIFDVTAYNKIYAIPFCFDPFECQTDDITVTRLPLPYYASASEKANPGQVDENNYSTNKYSLGMEYNQYFIKNNLPVTDSWGRDRYHISIPKYDYEKDFAVSFISSKFSSTTEIEMRTLEDSLDSGITLFDEDRDFTIYMDVVVNIYQTTTTLYPACCICAGDSTIPSVPISEKHHTIKAFFSQVANSSYKSLHVQTIGSILSSNISNNDEIKLIITKRGHTLYAFAKNVTTNVVGIGHSYLNPNNFSESANYTLKFGFGDMHPNMIFKTGYVYYGAMSIESALNTIDYKSTDVFDVNYMSPLNSLNMMPEGFYMDQKHLVRELDASHEDSGITLFDDPSREFAIFTRVQMNHTGYTQSNDWYPGIIGCYNSRIDGDTNDLIFFGICNGTTGNISAFILNNVSAIDANTGVGLFTANYTDIVKALIVKRGQKLIAIMVNETQDPTHFYYSYKNLQSIENFDPNDGGSAPATMYYGHSQTTHAYNLYKSSEIWYGSLEDKDIKRYFGVDTLPDLIQRALNGENP